MEKMKEKRREKKKNKEKISEKNDIPLEQTVLNSFKAEESTSPLKIKVNKIEPLVVSDITATTSNVSHENCGQHHSKQELIRENTRHYNQKLMINHTNIGDSNVAVESNKAVEPCIFFETTEAIEEQAEAPERQNMYNELSYRLQSMALPEIVPDIIALNEIEEQLQAPEAYLDSISTTEKTSLVEVKNISPSAPTLEGIPSLQTHKITRHYPELIEEAKIKVEPMTLNEAIRLCGAKEIAEIKSMSEREEEIIEAGSNSNSEHPLVDLLSTFRCSLAAMERERINIARKVVDEEKYRNGLWKIEKRYVNMTEKCKCGLNVQFQGTYEHAELLKENLPTARMKLEALCRDVQDSYCHYQHSALMSYYQIEELIHETAKGSKACIREALCVVLAALRRPATAVWAEALQRWARALCEPLLHQNNMTHLIYLLHHLFRQTLSVRWAVPLIRVSCNDSTDAARVIALIDLLLGKTAFEAAVECTEEEAWEEVDVRGSGAVSEGALRERDLMALLRALPLRALLARLVLIPHMDIRTAVEREWCADGGRGVVRACAGVRTLIAALQRALQAHHRYTRLCAEIRALALRALTALAALHLHNMSGYSSDLKERVEAELEAAFADGFVLMDETTIHELPTTLLSHSTALEYCAIIITDIHDKSVKRLKCLCVEIPALGCERRVRVAARAVRARSQDAPLAEHMLYSLMQIGYKHKTSPCNNGCEVTARASLIDLIDAHQNLHTTAFYILADFNKEGPLEASIVKNLSPQKWRPTDNEVKSLLDDWSRRCPQFIEHLLLDMDYTPNIGVCLEAQLSIGTWVRGHVRASNEPPEWAWRVLRRLRLHRVWWGARPPLTPPTDPSGLFDDAYALLTTSWGHCIPLVCAEEAGAGCLRRLARARPRDAAHCLAPLMLLMAHSPDSVSLTPAFAEAFTALLNTGPSLMQRALGRGAPTGQQLLLRIVLSQLDGQSTFRVSRSCVVLSWLHALWRPALPPSALAVLDTALVACRDWPHIDYHASSLIRKCGGAPVSHCVRHAASAPLVCEAALRAAAEPTLHTVPLLLALHAQRLAGRRIHVDDALKDVGARISSEELAIYQTASAIPAVPFHHPSHLMMWRLLMHLYLQRPPGCLENEAPPVGPLFFSGFMKSRTLAQLKKRLQDAISYHENMRLQATEHESEQNTSESEPTTSKIMPSTSQVMDDDLLPTLSLEDFTGKTSHSSESNSESDESVEEHSGDVNEPDSAESEYEKWSEFHLMCYHVAAEKMLREYARWLEEGDKTRAMPHDADVARFISEQGLEAAWRQEVRRRTPPPLPDADDYPLPCEPPLLPPPKLPLSPLKMAIDSIMAVKCRNRSARRFVIRSQMEDVNLGDARTLLQLVEKLLKEIESFSREWVCQRRRVRALSAELWPLVGALRQRRPLPPATKRCANSCSPLTFLIPYEESCLLTGAEKGIIENRSKARTVLKKMAKPRPHAAKTMAALSIIGRAVSSRECARRVASLIGLSAGVTRCAAAADACAALVTHLATEWLCEDGEVCAELISQWAEVGSSAGDEDGAPGAVCGDTQQALCGALVVPRRLRPDQWPPLYTALLMAPLPSHTKFSCLSKFELGVWVENAQPAQRLEVLEALLRAVQRWGPAPDPDHHVLLELLYVHVERVSGAGARELQAACARAARASAGGRLPPALWPHLAAAARRAAATHRLHFDQLGHLLRELGVIWWEARTSRGERASAHYVTYAPHVATLLNTLLRAFVHAAIAQSYTLERVSWCVWSGVRDSWSVWVAPSPAAPLLPLPAPASLVPSFLQTLQDIIAEAPGIEPFFLEQIFLWIIQNYIGINNASCSPENRTHLSELLVALIKLPWNDHQWWTDKCLHPLIQICSNGEREMKSWCSDVMRATTAAALVCGAAHDELAPRLAALLYLFTALPLHHETLEEAARLPWSRLPEVALDQAMDRFFVQYYNPSVPYHELPQFSVVMCASELAVSACGGGGGGVKRTAAVSHWVRAAAQPPLVAHAHAAAEHMLRTLERIAPYIENSENEIELLLSRAVILLCVEPAAAAALPAWQRWLPSASPRLVRASLSVVASLTVFEYFAILADVALKTHLNHPETRGWEEVVSRWSSCPWREPAALAARGHLTAAYGAARAHPPSADGTRRALLALANTDIDFVENEVMCGVWVCVAARAALEGGDAGQAGRALVARWGAEPRRSLLRALSLQGNTGTPTARVRLLCRLAECVASPSEATARAYEACCGSWGGSGGGAGGGVGDAAGWGRKARPRLLPRLAHRLFPNCDQYFKAELDLTPDD